MPVGAPAIETTRLSDTIPLSRFSTATRRAGFDGITTTEKSFQMRFADGSALLRHYFIRLGFLEGWMKVVPPERVDETFLALERNLNKAAAVHGELALTIPMACVEARKPANPYQTA